ncbi:MAG: hypothetical protein ACK6DP_09270 [Gemmatimonas sp.]
MPAGSFVNALRVRPEVLRLAPPDTDMPWTLRVQAAEAWDAVRVECTPDTTVGAVKQAAMANLLPDIAQPEAYLVKLHGAEVRDEGLTLRQVGARDASTLFLTSRRRRPLK